VPRRASVRVRRETARRRVAHQSLAASHCCALPVLCWGGAGAPGRDGGCVLVGTRCTPGFRSGPCQQWVLWQGLRRIAQATCYLRLGGRPCHRFGLFGRVDANLASLVGVGLPSIDSDSLSLGTPHIQVLLTVRLRDNVRKGWVIFHSSASSPKPHAAAVTDADIPGGSISETSEFGPSVLPRYGH